MNPTVITYALGLDPSGDGIVLADDGHGWQGAEWRSELKKGKA